MGQIRSHNISLSSSTEHLNSFFSIGYFGNDGVTKNSNLNRISGRSNIKYEKNKFIFSFDEGAFQKDTSFTYNRAVMPIATARLAIAAAKYGMTDTSLLYIKKILNTFSYATPGTTYEVSPDYGMFVQAWNVIGINVPVIFGINPDAHNKRIDSKLQMPEAWDKASLKNLLIGDNKVSFYYEKSGNKITYTTESVKADWTINFVLNSHYKNIHVNGKDVLTNEKTLALTGKQDIL